MPSSAEAAPISARTFGYLAFSASCVARSSSMSDSNSHQLEASGVFVYCAVRVESLCRTSAKSASAASRGDAYGTNVWAEDYRSDSDYIALRREGWTPDCWPHCQAQPSRVISLP